MERAPGDGVTPLVQLDPIARTVIAEALRRLVVTIPQWVRIPGIYLVALWLRDEDGGRDGDVVVPLAPAPPPLEAGRNYPPAEIRPLLQRLAEERLAVRDVG